jgi:tRNA pseudouridine55 synthase
MTLPLAIKSTRALWNWAFKPIKKGAVTATAPYSDVTLEKVREGAKQFTGEIIQVPPMVSALKHQGVRLYKLARRGVEVPREGRNVTVHHFNIEKMDGPNVHFSAHVSKGTYVRTLVNDLGEALGCYAALKELRRTRSGEFRLEDSVTVDQLREWTIQDVRDKVMSIQTRYANLQRD